MDEKNAALGTKIGLDSLVRSVGPSFNDVAAELRKLTASRRQTLSETLLREGREER